MLRGQLYTDRPCIGSKSPMSLAYQPLLRDSTVHVDYDTLPWAGATMSSIEANIMPSVHAA